jgi:hypothetical protein
MSDPSELLHTLLVNELRRAVAARVEAGTDPTEVTADLGQRLLSLHRMQREVPLHHSAPTSDSP